REGSGSASSGPSFLRIFAANGVKQMVTSDRSGPILERVEGRKPNRVHDRSAGQHMIAGDLVEIDVVAKLGLAWNSAPPQLGALLGSWDREVDHGFEPPGEGLVDIVTNIRRENCDRVAC